MKNRALTTYSRITSPLSVSLLVLLATSFVFAQRFDSDEQNDLVASQADRQVSLLVSRLMQKDHLSRRALDDNISRRAFDMFTRALDPMKIYFMQSDIEEFRNFDDKIDDRMKGGDYSIAFTIFNRFLDRVDQRVQTAMEMIERDFDYKLDEEIVTDRDLIQYAKTEAEAEDRWRKRIKYNLMVLSTEKEAKDDPKEKLKKRYKSYARRMHQTDSNDVVEMFISSITSSFDPHTTYMSNETFENFMISMRLQLEGIGATLQASEDDGYTIIKRIVPGGAADKQGELKVEDKIVAVGQGNEGEMNDVTGFETGRRSKTNSRQSGHDREVGFVVRKLRNSNHRYRA